MQQVEVQDNGNLYEIFESWPERIQFTKIGDVYRQDGYDYKVTNIHPEKIVCEQMFGSRGHITMTENGLITFGGHQCFPRVA